MAKNCCSDGCSDRIQQVEIFDLDNSDLPDLRTLDVNIYRSIGGEHQLIEQLFEDASLEIGKISRKYRNRLRERGIMNLPRENIYYSANTGGYRLLLSKN